MKQLIAFIPMLLLQNTVLTRATSTPRTKLGMMDAVKHVHVQMQVEAFILVAVCKYYVFIL